MDTAPAIARIQPEDDADTSRNSAAYRAIRLRIVQLELAPASLIDERKLAEEMQLGLTPVRHALRRLALEQLVEILPRRGTRVADLNPADLGRLFEMRLELEALAAQLAAQRITPTQAAALADYARQTRAAQLEVQLEAQQSARPQLDDAARAAFNTRLITLDHSMHELLSQAAHNRYLHDTLDWLYSHVLRLWNTGLARVTALDRAMEEHCLVADAVLAGDAPRAAALMRAHVQHFQQQFLELDAPGAASETESPPA